MPSDDTSQPEVAPGNAECVERLLEKFSRAGDGAPAPWRQWIDRHRDENGSRRPAIESPKSKFRPQSIFNPVGEDGSSTQTKADDQRRQQAADDLLHAYRTQGHLWANVDPLGLADTSEPDLSPEQFGLGPSDTKRSVLANVQGQQSTIRIDELIEFLEQTYCGSVGFQVSHLEDPAQREWLLDRIESGPAHELSSQQRRRILKLLSEAVEFEEFMRKKYIGAKTFSLEGAETLIPLLDLAIDHAAAQGVQEIVLGMPHRGRLNVLANIVGQPMRKIFAQFEDNHPELHLGGGDVKYHLGASGNRTSSGGQDVHLSLCFNPSHVEFVNPMALGRVRAKQDRTEDAARRRGMAVLIHGDAAFAGEGIVQESLNLCRLDGYEIGGTLHIIMNNQLGFTTGPAQGRSTTYPSDVATFAKTPVFHVNGERPEAVARVVRLAMDYRHEFQHDVVIDLFCFRRHGHNEADEPSFTQPLMYQAVEHHPPLRDLYLEDLSQGNGVSDIDAETFTEAFRQRAKEEHQAAQQADEPADFVPAGIWEG